MLSVFLLGAGLLGGYLITPNHADLISERVEQVLLELDFVSAAMVYGEPNPIVGQVVAAKVVLTGAPDAPDTLRRIRVHCRSRLARHMVPVRIDFVAGSLSTPRHKIQRTLRN